jgi:hypothetical protein
MSSYSVISSSVLMVLPPPTRVAGHVLLLEAAAEWFTRRDVQGGSGSGLPARATASRNFGRRDRDSTAQRGLGAPSGGRLRGHAPRSHPGGRYVAGRVVMLSLTLPASVRIFLCRQPTDMRKSFDGLMGLVEQVFGEDPSPDICSCFSTAAATRSRSWSGTGRSVHLVQAARSRHVRGSLARAAGRRAGTQRYRPGLAAAGRRCGHRAASQALSAHQRQGAFRGIGLWTGPRYGG